MIDQIPDGWIRVSSLAARYHLQPKKSLYIVKSIEQRKFLTQCGRSQQHATFVREGDAVPLFEADKNKPKEKGISEAWAKEKRHARERQLAIEKKIAERVIRPVRKPDVTQAPMYAVTADFGTEQHVRRMAQRGISVAKIALRFGLRIMDVTILIQNRAAKVQTHCKCTTF